MRSRCGKQFNCEGRWTAPRQAVLDIFVETGGHLTAEDVFLKIKSRNAGVGLATVYRTLEFLCRQGVIKRHQFCEGRAHYELDDDTREHHHHLICKECGTVFDYSEFVERELNLMKDLEKELSHKHNFDIDSHELQFYGVCISCRK